MHNGSHGRRAFVGENFLIGLINLLSE